MIRYALLGLLIAAAMSSLKADSSGESDDLEIVEPVSANAGKYERVWRDKLLVTSGDVARFVQLPGSNGVESSVSIYRDRRKKGEVGGYRLTRTTTATPLVRCSLPRDNKDYIDPARIKILRCDAPIPASTAESLHNLWLTMLARRKSGPDPDKFLFFDPTTELFSARDNAGTVVEGAAPRIPVGENALTMALVKIGFHLLDYCDLRVEDRDGFARTIEREANSLQQRLDSRAK
jgi:hypothetical protein